MHDWTMTDDMARTDIAGLDNDGPMMLYRGLR